MALLRVNPTRMELTRLKKRLKVAIRGHKLLKDKRDEMIRQFIQIIKQNKKLRQQVEGELSLAQREFTLASMSMNTTAMEEALMSPSVRFEFKTSLQNIMSVMVPRIEFAELPREMSYFPYGLFGNVGCAGCFGKKTCRCIRKDDKISRG